MSRGWIAYGFVGMGTALICMVGMLSAMQSGTVNISVSSSLRMLIIYMSLFISAVQSGICWPLYWFGIGIAKLIDLVDDDEGGGAA